MAQPSREELLKSTPVKQAVMALALPTIISQLINVIYNLADIFFVGQIGDPAKVAAVSLVSPAFLLTTALGNLFGIGGSSAIARALGKKDVPLAKQHTTFCFYACLAAAALYSLLLAIFSEPFLRLYGASDATLVYAKQYTFWVLIIGSVPAVGNVVLAHMLRADGKPRIASLGLSMGGILNILLDPLFIIVLKLEVVGVAVATMLSNTIVLIFFLIYWMKNRKDLLITLDPQNLAVTKAVCQPVFASGVPAAVQTFVVSLFFMFLNRQARNYSDLHVAALGIVQKLDMIPQNVSLGLAQGVIPLLGYSYAAKNYERMENVSFFALTCGLIFSGLFVLCCELFTTPLVSLFIPDSPETIALSTRFARIMCLCTPLMAICNIMNSTFQATGQAKQALSICLFRKVYVGLPLLFLLDWLLPDALGIMLVTALVDGIAAFYVFYLYRKFKSSLGFVSKRKFL